MNDKGFEMKKNEFVSCDVPRMMMPEKKQKVSSVPQQ